MTEPPYVSEYQAGYIHKPGNDRVVNVSRKAKVVGHLRNGCFYPATDEGAITGDRITVPGANGPVEIPVTPAELEALRYTAQAGERVTDPETGGMKGKKLCQEECQDSSLPNATPSESTKPSVCACPATAESSTSEIQRHFDGAAETASASGSTDCYPSSSQSSVSARNGAVPSAEDRKNGRLSQSTTTTPAAPEKCRAGSACADCCAPGVTGGSGTSVTASRFSEGLATTSEVRVTDPLTGGSKGKKLATFSSIPSDVLWELAEHFGAGERKYPNDPETGQPNWQKGYDWRLNVDALSRHLHLWLQGEDTDPETGSNHLIAVIWHAIVLRWFQIHSKGKDFR